MKGPPPCGFRGQSVASLGWAGCLLGCKEEGNRCVWGNFPTQLGGLGGCGGCRGKGPPGWAPSCPSLWKCEIGASLPASQMPSSVSCCWLPPQAEAGQVRPPPGPVSPSPGLQADPALPGVLVKYAVQRPRGAGLRRHIGFLFHSSPFWSRPRSEVLDDGATRCHPAFTPAFPTREKNGRMASWTCWGFLHLVWWGADGL